MASTRSAYRGIGLGLLAGVAVATAPRAASAQSCGDLLIVYDRSGSMVNCTINGQTKEAIAKKVLKAVATQFNTTPMGLMVFPDTLSMCPTASTTEPLGANACNPGKVVIQVVDNGASMIGPFLDTMRMSCGGTPTGRTMEAARDYNNWSTTAKNHYVLLLTDGEPTCDDGDMMGFTATRSATGAWTCNASPTCAGRGNCYCSNPTKAYNAITEMFNKGVHTFVVGFAGMGTGTGCGTLMAPPFRPETLDRMAELGGEPATGTMHKYYSAEDEASLKAALDTILGRIVGGTVGGCAPGGGGGMGGGTGGSGGGGGTDGGAGGNGGGAGGNGGSAGTDGGVGGKGGSGVRTSSPGCGCTTSGRPLSSALSFLAVVGLGLVARRVRRR